jgi:hypothetical protein
MKNDINFSKGLCHGIFGIFFNFLNIVSPHHQSPLSRLKRETEAAFSYPNIRLFVPLRLPFLARNASRRGSFTLFF